MNFAKFSRRSLTVRSGYGIDATHKIRGIPLRPHARVGYGRELHTDPVRVSTGMNAMPGAVADVHENMRARNSRVGTRRQTTQQQPQAQARLARMAVPTWRHGSLVLPAQSGSAVETEHMALRSRHLQD